MNVYEDLESGHNKNTKFQIKKRGFGFIVDLPNKPEWLYCSYKNIILSILGFLISLSIFIFTVLLISVILFILPLTFPKVKNSENYKVTSIKYLENGLTAKIELIQGKQSEFSNQDIHILDLFVYYETESRLRIQIKQNGHNRWEVPNVVLTKTPTKSPENKNYDVKLLEKPFGFQVIRKSTNDIIFDTTKLEFVYSEQYLSIGTHLKQKSSIYGFGERFTETLKMKVGKYPLWSKGSFVFENAKNFQQLNTYSSQPFYLQKDGIWSHGVFFLNSNAMEVELTSHNTLQMRTTGGIIDLFFFVPSSNANLKGNSPNDVIVEYQKVIGKPRMIPRWSLGFHASRWGLKSIEETKDVVVKYRNFSIPIDTMWSDIDYMDKYKLFTRGENFTKTEMNDFINYLHNKNMKYVVIVDPGVKVEEGYNVFIEGLKQNVFIKQNDSKTPIEAQVWPGNTVFPDWSHPNTYDYWKNQIKQFYDDTPIDGLWTDMNEIDAFCDGSCYDPNYKNISESNLNQDYTSFSYNGLPMNPNNPPFSIARNPTLDKETIKNDALLYGKVNLNENENKNKNENKNINGPIPDVQNRLQYNQHNLYGFHESIMTSKALKEITNKRPFTLTRSSFPGSGRYTYKWLGDNKSSFLSLRTSIPGILLFNFFGIPLIGSDICGYAPGNKQSPNYSKEQNELCIRWYEIGSFYPFSRTHHSIDADIHWPWSFKNIDDKLIHVAKDVLTERYKLIPYYYTLFYHANKMGGVVWSPLFFEFTNDENLDEKWEQFLIGDSILVCPVLEAGKTSVECYFPRNSVNNDNEIWYNYKDGKLITFNNKEEKIKNFNAPLGTINSFVRGGKIIPKKYVGNQNQIKTTKDVHDLDYEFVVALCSRGKSFGYLYVDDGISYNYQTDSQYVHAKIEAINNQTKGEITFEYFEKNYPHFSYDSKLKKIQVYGIHNEVKTVEIDGIPLSKDNNWNWNKDNSVLTIELETPREMNFDNNIVWTF